MTNIVILFFSIFFYSSFLQAKTVVLQAQQETYFDQILQKAAPEWNIIIIDQKKKRTDIEKSSLINRLNPDFFLIIQLTVNAKKNPSCSFYTFAWSPTDKWPKTIDPLDFVPFFQAHYIHAHDSHKYASQLYESFKKREPSFVPTFYYECPFKPLEGIVCPALAIELVLPSIELWNNQEPFVVQAIKTMLDSIIVR